MLRIAISAYPTCIQRLREGGRGVTVGILHVVWYGQTRMAKRQWKNFEDIFICFDRMYERDRYTNTHTDTHTPHDGISRDCIASRGSIARQKFG